MTLWVTMRLRKIYEDVLEQMETSSGDISLQSCLDGSTQIRTSTFWRKPSRDESISILMRCCFSIKRRALSVVGNCQRHQSIHHSKSYSQRLTMKALKVSYLTFIVRIFPLKFRVKAKRIKNVEWVFRLLHWDYCETRLKAALLLSDPSCSFNDSISVANWPRISEHFKAFVNPLHPTWTVSHKIKINKNFSERINKVIWEERTTSNTILRLNDELAVLLRCMTKKASKARLASNFIWRKLLITAEIFTTV